MSNNTARSLSNSFQDVRLVSLASWSKAAEINPRDPHGPYVVTQEGYDPADPALNVNEFILGRSGKWLALGLFYKLPVPERRAEFIFGTVAEVMKMLGGLTSKIAVFRPGELATEEAAAAGPDEMAAALAAGKNANPPKSA